MKKLILPLILSFTVLSKNSFTHSLKNSENRSKAIKIAQKYKLDNLIPYILDERFEIYKLKRRKLNKKIYFKLLDISKKIVVARQILNTYARALKNVEKTYYVDKEAIAAIISIETHGGKFVGKYKLINAIFSMYLNKGIFLNQLKALNKMVGDGFDPYVFSSFAGAFGYPQFLPLSYLNYGVDGNKDGKIDLFNMEDAISSVANYLSSHGWKKDKKKAIFSYNPSDWYVEAFFKIYKSLKKIPQ